MIGTPRRLPGVRTPTSGVIIEMLYLCAVGLSAGIGAWAIGARSAERRSSPVPPKPSVSNDALDE